MVSVLLEVIRSTWQWLRPEQKHRTLHPRGQGGPSSLSPHSHSPKTSSSLNLRQNSLSLDPDIPPMLEEITSHSLLLCPREYITRLHEAKGFLPDVFKSSHCKTQPSGYCASAGLSPGKTYFRSKIYCIMGKTSQHLASSSGSFQEPCLL